MTSIKLMKNEIRDGLLTVRHEIPSEVKKAAEEKILSSFFSLASVRYAKTVLLYSPIKDELDVLEIAEEAVKRGKRVAFPVSEKDEPIMRFYYVDDLSSMEKGTFGIFEPKEGSELYSSDGSKDVCIVPAVSFDLYGHRLGYGKGYYDRFLSNFSGVKIGLCLEKLMSKKLPCGRFDVPMDVVITEKGVMIPRER